MPSGYTIRSFHPASDADKAGLLKLWRDASGFDALVPTMTPTQLDALLAHPTSEKASAWRVAVASNDAMVGALTLRFVGSLRTELTVAVNPAWRGRDIAKNLLQEAPRNKRLLVTSRASVSAATELFEEQGFSERFRTLCLRQKASAYHEGQIALPSWASIEEDQAREPLRYIAAARSVFGEDEIDDPRYVAAQLQRPGMRVLYLSSPKGDDGIVLLGPSPQVKKNELNEDGSCSVGLLHRVALSKAVRGKGVSLPLIRAGLQHLIADGYRTLEVRADKRRKAALDLYFGEGFKEHDEDVHWLKPESDSPAT